MSCISTTHSTTLLTIYGILCISTISLIAGAWALYHAWRLNNNSEKENLDPDILPSGVFLMLAALASGALLPYFSQALRCNNILSKKNKTIFVLFFFSISSLPLLEQGLCTGPVDRPVEEVESKTYLETFLKTYLKTYLETEKHGRPSKSQQYIKAFYSFSL